MTQKLFAAPMQGHTDAPWRHYHAEVYGAADAYFTPFLRVERGEVRRRDAAALCSPLNENHTLRPQIIAADAREFRMLVDAVRGQGYAAVDLNMGCPFPPQVHHGRGAALVENPEVLREIAALMQGEYSDVDFSVKMRLGVADPQGWRAAADILESMPLSLLTVHPRVALQQYKGDLFIDEFERLLAATRHRVVFNGDLLTPADVLAIARRYPELEGIMVGRGLMGRPSLFAEVREGREWDEREQLEAAMRLHGLLLEHYKQSVSGDGQILNKIQPFWEYMEPLAGRKAVKALRKAGSLTKYESALAQVGR